MTEWGTWGDMAVAHRRVWAEDGAPLHVCWICQTLWPCDRVREVADALRSTNPHWLPETAETFAVQWLNHQEEKP